MPRKLLQFSQRRWPETYGFEIYGNGPSYVVSVQTGSVASQAGLLPGDQLLEVNGQDVTNMSASCIKTLARECRLQPPALEVVACLCRLTLRSLSSTGYGFTVLNERPVVVGSVDFEGAAYQAGLRVGDIILEVNGRQPEGVETVGRLLSQPVGRLTLLTIPVGRNSNLVHVDKALSRLPPSDPRFHRARDLFKKIGSILGNDYRRKMAVVTVLKRYAEDRDVNILCRSLDVILNTPDTRLLLRHIRPLVSPQQRSLFDDMMSSRKPTNRKTSPAHSDRSASHLSSSSRGLQAIPVSHTVGTKKVLQVVRDNGSFGFVVKGCNPAYIESVDPYGPADEAGLLPGDFLLKLNGLDVRRCDHDRLIELLQNSGSAPTIQILRRQDSPSSVRSLAASVTSLNRSFSESSHASDILPFEQDHLDSEGKTFTQRVEFLLTPKERMQLKRALQLYELNRDIVKLHARLDLVLDTPTKCMLWKFILLTILPQHQDYVLHRIGLPRHILTELLDQPGSRNLASHTMQSTRNFETFQDHLDFLLTARERGQFRSAVHNYQENQNLSALMEVLSLILDSPSKQVLWRYVLPYLTPGHQDYILQRTDIPESSTVPGLTLPGMDSYIGLYSKEGYQRQTLTAMSNEEDILYGEEKEKDADGDDSLSETGDVDWDMVSDKQPVKTTSRMTEGGKRGPTGEEEGKLLKQSVQDVKETLKGKNQRGKAHTNSDNKDNYDRPILDSKHFVTIIPVGYPNFEVAGRPFYSKEMDWHEFEEFRRKAAASGHAAVTSQKDQATQLKAKHSASAPLDQRESTCSSSDSESESMLYTVQMPQQHTPTGITKDSDTVVLKKLEIVVASETSSDSNSPLVTTPAKAKNLLTMAVPPAPPAPPPPKSGQDVTRVAAGPMNVKRINWEKLDNKNVENTIWEQVGEADLTEVIRYLELETQFSTKPFRSRDKDKKREVCIMSAKKAYNICHLKMSVSDIKQAVLSMDQDTLTPELLTQLIAYAPSKQEVELYDAYRGELDDLSKADQFSYQMSQVHGYEQRLKALLFKANFKEKMEEMKESLKSVRVASLELHHSKKLARLLELILAMGNYMNKGNSRVGEAAGFRITFLTQLDITKTADSSSTFLHVVADTCYTKFPELLSLADDLSTLSRAARVSSEALNQELLQLRKGLQDISGALDRVDRVPARQNMASSDQFQEVMRHFISQASDEIEAVLRLQGKVMEDFNAMVTFFGEDPHLVTTTDIFNIFNDFVGKFQKAHGHNMMYKRQ